MRRMQNYALLLCLGCIGAAISIAQASLPEVEITKEPHHHLVLENEYLRAFRVTVAPGTQTEMHVHRHDYVTVNLGAAELSNGVKDKEPVTVKFSDGDTRFGSAPLTHFVRDTGPEPFRNLTIELLQDKSSRNSTAQWDEERGLDVLPNGTKQILFVKDGVRVSEFELQPNGAVPREHHTGAQLLVAVSDLNLRNEVEARGHNPSPKSADSAADVRSFDNGLQMKSGDLKWFPAGSIQTIVNGGSSTAKFVTLEFP